MRIREVQKHTDPTDPDPQHWFTLRCIIGQAGPVTVADIDAEFLPLIYDIVKCVERDPGDAAAKNKVHRLILSSPLSRSLTVPF
jgi:hypothetical protein